MFVRAHMREWVSACMHDQHIELLYLAFRKAGSGSDKLF